MLMGTHVEAERSTLVIFGASGDLTGRKLAPAIYNLARQDQLPEQMVLVGYGRTEMTDQQFRSRLREWADEFSRTQPVQDDVWDPLAEHIFYQRGSYEERGDIEKLDQRLEELDDRFGIGGSRIFYLAVPPEVVPPILENLSDVGALERRTPCHDERGCHLRAVFEKPFGRDRESARELNDLIDHLLDESQVFRMDHYLGKETVQNITVLRFANSIFENVWSSDSVRWVRCTVAESIGVEDRGGYFDSTGILRDILQNHVLQLLTLVTMEPPSSLAADAIRDEKVKVLRCLRRLEGDEVSRSVIRGQYGVGTVNGEQVVSYRQEGGVPNDSDTETFVGLRTYIDNWRWAGVPIYLCAGKRLPTRLAEVAVEFKRPPRVLFGALRDVALEPNRLTLRIQPDEGVSLRFTTKEPGIELALKNVEMDFPYSSAFPAASPEAYERLLLDVMAGSTALFARRDEVELEWDFATAILDQWDAEPPPDFPNYRVGTWGPISTEDFFSPDTDYSQAPNPSSP